LNKYQKAFLVNCDNVGSKQFQDIRRAIRGSSIILMGKNTLLKQCLRSYLNKGDVTSQKWKHLPNLLTGNVGLVLTEGDLREIRATLLDFKIGACARVGAISPCDVKVKSGNTGMDPSATSFFQALNIPTKINKGTVEIIKEMTVVKAGERVGNSSATLLAKLGLKPFTYGLKPLKMFDNGNTFDVSVLDVGDKALNVIAWDTINDLVSVVSVMNIAHSLKNSHKISIYCRINDLTNLALQNVLATASTTEYNSWEIRTATQITKSQLPYVVTKTLSRATTLVSSTISESNSEDMGFSLFD
jgi:large subunit ribosomal protein LP0